MATARKDYTALAKQRIRKPGTRPLRFLVYGRNKVGKTTFGASAPKTLVVDPESGGEALGQDVDLWPISRWPDLDEVWRFLREGKHPYENVCFDGLTRMSNMALRFVMKMQEERDLDRIPGMVQQRDYGKAGELMKGMLFNLHTLPVGIVYTAQERMESSAGFGDAEDEDSEEVEARFVPDLPRGVRSSVNAIVDVIGRLYTVKVEGIHPKTGKEIKGIQRRMWLAPSDVYDTGARSGTVKLPEYIKGPTVPKLTELIRRDSING